MSLFNNQASTSIESFSTDKKLAYGIFKNGLWRKIKTPLGHFTHKVKDLPDNLGLNKVCEVAFEKDNAIPAIPYTIYYEILEFYRKIYKEIKSEVYTCIVWDREREDFFIHVPKQTVSGAEVKFENEASLFNNVNYVPYCDIHSHNTMNAFFSAGDVKDEVSGRFYGVIGNIDHEIAKHVFKVSYDRQFVDLDATQVFDVTKEKLHEDSDYTINYESVILNVTERVKKAYAAPVKSKAVVLPGTYTGVYTGGNYIDGSDDDYYDYTNFDYGYNNKNRKNKYQPIVYDITGGTKLVSKKGTDVYKLFAYDFAKVFNYSVTKQNDIINLYHSLTNLILSEDIDVEDTTVWTITTELLANLPTDSE